MVDERIRRLINDMLETMYDAPVGLAASQVNVHERVVVIDVSEERNEPRVFINPEIEVLDENLALTRMPVRTGFYETVHRPRCIKVTALDQHGEAFVEALDGLMAICLQHEIDHLEGKLFVDHISDLKRRRIRSKLEKSHRRNA